MIARYFLASFALAGLAATVAAQIPNGGFENWSTPPGANYQDPDGWITLNALTTLEGGQPSCAPGSPGAVGSHYATVTTQGSAFGAIQGLATVGDVNTGSTGFAYAGRPAAFTGQWQYGIQSGDEGMVAVYFTKWNPGTQSADSVGAAVGVLSGSLGSWTPFSIPVVYFSSANPDTAYVAVLSSMNNPVPGSFVKIDALAFGGTSGIAEAAGQAGTRVFPSPASNLLNVVAERPLTAVRVLDMTGRVVLERGVAGAQAQLDVSGITTGRYVLELTQADGGRVVRNFVKE